MSVVLVHVKQTARGASVEHGGDAEVQNEALSYFSLRINVFWGRISLNFCRLPIADAFVAEPSAARFKEKA